MITIPGSWQAVLTILCLILFLLATLYIWYDERQKRKPPSRYDMRPWHRRIWRGPWPKSQHSSYFASGRQWPR